MSLKKIEASRLGLLAGSSLAVALAFALAPSAALAADECAPVGTSPSANGAAADVFACAGSSTYTASGITYSSDGPLTVGSTGGMSVGTVGVNLTANGTDSATFTATGVITGTAGPVIEVNSAGATATPGALSITTAGVTGTAVGVTYGINAASATGAAIAVSNLTGNVNVNSSTAGAMQQSAIRAVSTGGAGNVSITTGSTITGRLRGIEAQASGAGTLTITATGAVTVNNGAGVGVAAIDARTGTGLLQIDLNAGATAVNGQSGAAVLANAGGNLDINIGAGRTVQAGAASAAVMNLTAAGAASVDNDGSLTASANNLVALRAAGGSLSLQNNGILLGRLDLSAVTGGATLNNGAQGQWSVSGANTFGSGVGILNNNGVIFVDGVTGLGGLDAFNNAGPVVMGGTASGFAVDPESDSVPGDVLAVTGGTFTGGSGSLILMDVNLTSGGSQASCVAAAAADCVDFTGASTAGSTLLRIRDSSLNAFGGTLGAAITLVDGASDAGDFSLDPASQYYRVTSQGGVLRKPVVVYHLVYDAAEQKHVLLGVPADEIYQVATLAGSAQETWRATTASWLTRQADLRATPGGLEPSGGMWARLGVGVSERDVDAVYDLAGLTIDYDLSHKQRTSHMVFGADMLGAATADSAWVVGAMIGFVRSDVEFDVASSEAISTGFTGGIYASWLAGSLFVDGVLNLNLLHVEDSVPQMGLGLDVPLTFDQKSLGGQVEAGWRVGLDSGFFVEPLVGASYVATKFDDALVPGGFGGFDFDEKYTSLRLGGGARLGLDSDIMGMTASYSLTGRYWDEAEGENVTRALGSGAASSALLTDDVTGGFSEISGSLNLYGSGGMSGFINLGGKFADGYQSIDGSIGVRARW